MSDIREVLDAIKEKLPNDTIVEHVIYFGNPDSTTTVIDCDCIVVSARPLLKALKAKE